MKEFLALIKFQLIILIRNKYEILNQIAFFVIFIISFPMIGQFSTHLLSKLAPTILLTFSYFIIATHQPNIWFKSQEDGTLDQEIIFTSFSKVIFSKLICSFLINICILYLLLPLLFVFYNLQFVEVLKLAITLFFFAISISSALSLSSLLCLNNQNIGLIYIISFPLSIATLILAYDFYYHFELFNFKFSDSILIFHSFFNILIFSFLSLFIYYN